MRALSVRQPWAELILRGVKTKEYRSRRTHVRGRVWVYACLGGVIDAEEEDWLREEYGIDAAGLPRGVLVGTVEVLDCQPSDEEGGFEWHLGRPQREREPQRPLKPPQPGFFNPF